MRINLKELLKRLLENEIDFVLVGGMACVAHGSPQVTYDLDVCVAINDEQMSKLRAALRDLSPRHRMNPSFKPSFDEHPQSFDGWKNVYLETDLGILDMLSELQPVGNFERIKREAVTVPLYGYSCKVVSIGDLIKVKESMGRPKDKEAVVYLNAILNRSNKP